MKKSLFLLLVAVSAVIHAQTKYFPIPGSREIPGEKINGTLDDITDFSTCTQVPFTMPDGTKLMTDIYLPILQDSFVYNDTLTFSLLPAPFPQVRIPIFAVLLQKGSQYLIYDTINGVPNPNPYQLPMILERTPYNKDGAIEGAAMALLGYAGAVQDMRGRYTSQGAYLPLYSDSWKKWPYHNYTHVLDITAPTDPRNGNNHEDGYNTLEFVKNQLVRKYDLNRDGIFETTDLVYNGSIGSFGASALGYNQLQAAAAHKIDPTKPGLRSMFPIVGPLEFYKSTGYQNGCLRDGLVTGWLRGQIKDTRDEDKYIDTGIDDDIHSSVDYGTPDKFDAANKAIDHFVTVRYENSACGYYPNSIGRSDMDASKAPVDINGEGDKNGTYSRYKNIEVPTFHVAGWWDIFVDGSIETHKFIQDNITQKKNLQKIVIGPWAHQTIASSRTGDKTYPKNVTDITKIDITNIGSGGDINIADIAKSELISWFRYNLNYNGYNKVGEPKVLIPKATTWQKPLPQLPALEVRFPSEDYKIQFADLLNFILGEETLKQVPVEVKLGALVIPFKIDLPELGPILEGFGTSGKFQGIPQYDYTTIPSIRYYVTGASNDDATISYSGNYWMGTEVFPPNEIQWHSMFLHQNGKLNFVKPTVDEGYKTYVHNPDDPIITVGGGNMIEQTPQGDRESQGQMNLADTNFAKFTMDREGVVKFETDVLQDSLCIVGFPKYKLYAKSNPGNTPSGPTDCDFFVRILDVYPDGKEFFVVEGAVNARAREFAKSIAEGNQNDNAPFSNIDIGKIYEYYFQGYPIAYSFAQGHKIKVLISSSNYPRFQACANVPIMPNEFFRRKPADGRTYIYNGTEYAPRISVQRIAISDQYPSQIELPVFGSTAVITSVKKPNATKVNWDVNLFPNPSDGQFSLFINKNGKYLANIYNMIGEKVWSREITEQHLFELKDFAKGQYLMELIDVKDADQKVTKSFTIN
ncbi:MAG TPA: CocE/NonD family hydrolase [Chitinophagales bacterium]|nr:CocE/NonD family hydrolase [Chitinophagales bacterium]